MSDKENEEAYSLFSKKIRELSEDMKNGYDPSLEVVKLVVHEWLHGGEEDFLKAAYSKFGEPAFGFVIMDCGNGEYKVVKVKKEKMPTWSNVVYIPMSPEELRMRYPDMVALL